MNRSVSVSLRLHNPHSVLAALDARPGDVLEVRLSGPKPSDAWKAVADRAAGQGVRVSLNSDMRDSRRRPRSPHHDEGGRTSASEALVRERAEVALEELFKTGQEARESASNATESPAEIHGLWLALDQLQDPQNVGAIFRTAAFFGVKGIVLTRDRSAPLSATVYDVASGGVEAVPFAQPANLARTLELAKKAGVWVLGSSERAPRDVSAIPHDRPWLLVLGNEEHGLRRLTLDTCDDVCRLTPRGKLTSLNVSAAAAVLIAALSR